MQKSGYHLDTQYLNYETDFNSVLNGIKNYKSDVHVLDSDNNRADVKVFYFRNITIDDDNRLAIDIKKGVKPFANFDDYYRRLLHDMSEMYLNARDERRVHKYGIVTMISKGYDAPCCATVVKKIGGDTALTFKAEGKYAEDSGVEIAEKLGYAKIIERDALAFKSRTDLPEIQYLSSGELGAEISFSVFEDDYKGNLVFTGERGDSIYDRASRHRNKEFHFIHMQSGLSNAEHRLWVGYVSVPMPLYGASAWPSLYDIANSGQMKDWQMNNSYDRPIPRRIIESAGIERECFGIKKRGAGFSYHYDWMKRIVSRMSPVSAEDFTNFVNAEKKAHPIQTATFLAKAVTVYMARLGIKKKTVNIEKMSKTPNPMAARYLIPWAGEHMLKQYKKVLEGE